MTQTHATREEWLGAAITELRPLFTLEGHPISDRIRVSCGFPAHHARSGKVGECHASAASADQHYEILISPVLADPEQVLGVLIAELSHTRPGCLGYGQGYQTACASMGLIAADGNWKAPVPVSTFGSIYSGILASLGPYPHAELSVGNGKTQSTRMLKAACPCCGYTIRLTQKWVDKGLPVCPVDGTQIALA